MKKRPADINSLIDDLAAGEQEFLDCEFLAPVVSHGVVQVRLGGVVCQVKIEPADFRGFGVFQPVSYKQAMLVRPATLSQRLNYLRLFPRVRLILTLREDGHWLTIPAHGSDFRFDIEGMPPVAMVQQSQTFDIINARFDGARFWFEQPDPSQNAATAAYLRQALAEEKPPADIQRPGLTPQQHAAYGVAYQQATQPPETQPPAPVADTRRRQQQTSRDRRSTARQQPQRTGLRAGRGSNDRARLRDGLAEAGGRLVDYLEHRDSFRVTFTVDGDQYVSAVNKSDLTVQAAGICLEGRDGDFDLQSLVGVIREGQQRDLIYRV